MAIRRVRTGRLLQAGLEFGHVAVGVPEALGLAQAYAVDDARVVEGVGDHRVLRPEQGLEQAAVGVEAGAVEDHVVGAEESASRRSSSLWISVVPQMKRTEAIPNPQRSRARWAADHRRVVGQAEVVVGAEIEDPTVPDTDLRRLRRVITASALNRPSP